MGKDIQQSCGPEIVEQRNVHRYSLIAAVSEVYHLGEPQSWLMGQYRLPYIRLVKQQVGLTSCHKADVLVKQSQL